MKEYETLRSEMKNIRKLEGGVVYHHDQSRSTASPRANSSATSSPSIAQRNSTTSSAPMSPSHSTSSVTSNNSYRAAQPHDPLSASTSNAGQASRDLSSMAQKAQKRTVRSMASSVVVEGDRRQRVDVSLRVLFSTFVVRC